MCTDLSPVFYSRFFGQQANLFTEHWKEWNGLYFPLMPVFHIINERLSTFLRCHSVLSRQFSCSSIFITHIYSLSDWLKHNICCFHEQRSGTFERTWTNHWNEQECYHIAFSRYHRLPCLNLIRKRQRRVKPMQQPNNYLISHKKKKPL